MHLRTAVRGFSLLELISVLVIIGVVSTVVLARGFSNDIFVLQAARDDMGSAIIVAQQHALSQPSAIRLLASGSTIDIRKDENDDKVFSADESLRHGTTLFPIQISDGVRIIEVELDFDRLGRTSPSRISLYKADRRVDVNVSKMGFLSSDVF